jgi:hypothetical protein
MREINLHFKTLQGGFVIGLVAKNEFSSQALYELLSIFSESHSNQLNINSVQVVTMELKELVRLYVKRYGELVPQIKKLNKKISDLHCCERFLLLEVEPDNTKDKLHFERLLMECNGLKSKDESYPEDEIFSMQLEAYSIFSPRSDIRNVIGEKNKRNRRCRFCYKTVSDGARFQSIAHAIPEALGNKNIILADECDVCNSFFGDHIEPSLIEFLNIYRVTLGVKGKEGYPKIKYENGVAQFDGKHINISSKDIDKDINGNLSIKLVSNNKFVPVAIYKALCKIALSVINKDELLNLDKTIEWLLELEHSKIELPKIGMLINYSGYSDHPKVIVLVRKDDSYLSPHVVCEFRLGCYVYVFIVPFSRKDKFEYLGDDQMKMFFDMFPQFSRKNAWVYTNFDSVLEIKPTYNIEMNNSEFSPYKLRIGRA